MLRKLLVITTICLALNACYGNDKQNKYDDYDQQEVIIVNKIPRGAFAGEELPPELRNIGWHDIGLSRNGEEPIEYIWRAGQEPYNYFIMLAEIGDRGTIHLDELAKHRNEKLPRPNAENPPIIGILGFEYWEKRE
jgi:hypothetical protein